MTNRVLLDPAGVKVSKAGVDVLTAAKSDLLFDSSAAAFPVLLKSYVHLTAAFNVVTPLYFGKTYSSPPFVSLFWSSGVPTSVTDLYGFCPPSNTPGHLWPTSYNPSSGDSTWFHWTVFNDRVEFVSKRDYSSGAAGPAYPMSGYVSAIVYDFW